MWRKGPLSADDGSGPLPGEVRAAPASPGPPLPIPPATPGATDLQARDVSVIFGGLVAVGNVSLGLARTEIFGLIGPNGAGKTTLVNCFTGFQRPGTGEIRIGGVEVSAWDPARFRKAGISRTFQGGRLFRDMTVLENVEVTAAGLGRKRRDSRRLALDVLDRFGMADKAGTIAGTLPYTDERRVGMARALVLAPRFVLLDEPAAGMSDAECDDLMQVIARIPADFRCGVLLVEHNMRVVMGICQRIHVLDSGRTIAEGTPAEIQSDQAVIAAYLGNGAATPQRTAGP